MINRVLRKFIKDYFVIAKPLSDLLNKDVKIPFYIEGRKAFKTKK